MTIVYLSPRLIQEHLLPRERTLPFSSISSLCLNLSRSQPGNQIENVDDTSIWENFTSLKILDLSENNIKNINGLNVLVTLTSLNLSRNQLASVIGIEALIHLKYLNVSYNIISNFPRNILRLRCLEELRLEHNLLSVFQDLQLLASLKNLVRLGIESNRYPCPDNARHFAIKLLPNLEELDGECISTLNWQEERSCDCNQEVNSSHTCCQSDNASSSHQEEAAAGSCRYQSLNKSLKADIKNLSRSLHVRTSELKDTIEKLTAFERQNESLVDEFQRTCPNCRSSPRSQRIAFTAISNMDSLEEAIADMKNEEHIYRKEAKKAAEEAEEEKNKLFSIREEIEEAEKELILKRRDYQVEINAAREKAFHAQSMVNEAEQEIAEASERLESIKTEYMREEAELEGIRLKHKLKLERIQEDAKQLDHEKKCSIEDRIREERETERIHKKALSERNEIQKEVERLKREVTELEKRAEESRQSFECTESQLKEATKKFDVMQNGIISAKRRCDSRKEALTALSKEENDMRYLIGERRAVKDELENDILNMEGQYKLLVSKLGEFMVERENAFKIDEAERSNREAENAEWEMIREARLSELEIIDKATMDKCQELAKAGSELASCKAETARISFAQEKRIEEAQKKLDALEEEVRNAQDRVFNAERAVEESMNLQERSQETSENEYKRAEKNKQKSERIIRELKAQESELIYLKSQCDNEHEKLVDCKQALFKAQNDLSAVQREAAEIGASLKREVSRLEDTRRRVAKTKEEEEIMRNKLLLLDAERSKLDEMTAESQSKLNAIEMAFERARSELSDMHITIERNERTNRKSEENSVKSKQHKLGNVLEGLFCEFEKFSETQSKPKEKELQHASKKFIDLKEKKRILKQDSNQKSVYLQSTLTEEEKQGRTQRDLLNTEAASLEAHRVALKGQFRFEDYPKNSNDRKIIYPHQLDSSSLSQNDLVRPDRGDLNQNESEESYFQCKKSVSVNPIRDPKEGCRAQSYANLDRKCASSDPIQDSNITKSRGKSTPDSIRDQRNIHRDQDYANWDRKVSILGSVGTDATKSRAKKNNFEILGTTVTDPNLTQKEAVRESSEISARSLRGLSSRKSILNGKDTIRGQKELPSDSDDMNIMNTKMERKIKHRELRRQYDDFRGNDESS